MVRDITLGQFLPGDSLMHRLDPRAKLGLTFRVQGETNLIGVHVEGDYSRVTGDMYAIYGMTLWAEYLDGIAVVTVGGASGASVQSAPASDKSAPASAKTASK